LGAVKLRPSNDGDSHFIYSSWLQSFREINVLKLKDLVSEAREYKTGPALWDRESYFKRQRHLIAEVLKVSEVSVCCSPDDEGQIFGFIVYRDYAPTIRIISYVYVKHTFRKLGMARKLFEALGECHVATHGGVSTKKLIQKAGLVYDPFFDYELGAK